MRVPVTRALVTALALIAPARVAHAQPEDAPAAEDVPKSTGAPEAPSPPSTAPARVPEAGQGPRIAKPETGNPAELPPHPPARTTGIVARDGGETSHPAPHGDYVHDGVFARAAVGPGLFQASSGRSPDRRSFSGGTVSIDAAIGGSPARGFALGAEFQTNRVFSLSSTDDMIDGDEPDLGDTSFSVSALALFADLYPDPSDGLHFLGAVGFGWLDVAHSGSNSTPTPTGPLLSLGVGYEWFVGPQISLGVLARGNIGLFSVNETGFSTSTGVTAFVPSILATATYN